MTYAWGIVVDNNECRFGKIRADLNLNWQPMYLKISSGIQVWNNLLFVICIYNNVVMNES